MRSFDLRFLTAICGFRMLLKTACSARGGVLYTQLAKFAALAVQAGVGPQTENCERRTAKTLITGRYRSGQTGQTVNLLAHAFAGSNPALPILRYLASSAASYGKPYFAETQHVTHLKPGEVCPSELG
jgi:hypothetical protein